MIVDIIIAVVILTKVSIVNIGMIKILTIIAGGIIDNKAVNIRPMRTSVNNMTQIIQVQSFKGGVGKTTTAINLAHAFARKGKRTLLIDLDHQGNATSGLGYKTDETTPTLYHVLVGGLKWQDAVATVRENLDLLPSNRMTALAESAMYPMLSREGILRRKLEGADEYDLIILDCPASLGILHINALCFATHIIVPVQIGVWSVDGLEQIFQSMEEVKSATGKMPEVLGALLTMVDERYALTEEVRALVKESFNGNSLPIIRTDADLMNAPKNCETIFEYNPNSKGAADYDTLATHLIKKLGMKTGKQGRKENAKAKKDK